MGTGLLPIVTIGIQKFAQKPPTDAAKVEFGDGLRGIRYQSSIYRPVQKITGVYLETDYCCAQNAINVDRNEEC